MQAREDAEYRISLARESLAEACRELEAQSWPICVDLCQQTVENAAKAVLALFGAPPPTHSPGRLLREIPPDQAPSGAAPAIEQLAQLSEAYGPDVHMRVRYGDEQARITPRFLFNEESARDGLAAAEGALTLAQTVIDALA